MAEQQPSLIPVSVGQQLPPRPRPAQFGWAEQSAMDGTVASTSSPLISCGRGNLESVSWARSEGACLSVTLRLLMCFTVIGVNTRCTVIGRCARAVGALHSSHDWCTPEPSQIARRRILTSGGPPAPTANIGSRPCSIHPFIAFVWAHKQVLDAHALCNPYVRLCITYGLRTRPVNGPCTSLGTVPYPTHPGGVSFRGTRAAPGSSTH